MRREDTRIIFMGTPGFAVASLEAIVEAGFQVVAVITAPGKPAGRGQKIKDPEVKTRAEELGLTVLQPSRLKDPAFIEQIKKFNPHLQVVVAFRMLPEEVWALPPMGTLNLHASLLPAYRGAAPINHAIINGERESGVTTFFIEKEIDTGKIILQERVPIQPTDTAGDLHDKLMQTGASLLVRTLDQIIAGKVVPLDQEIIVSRDPRLLKPAPKIFKENCQVNWNLEPGHVINLIRGLSPYPGAWSTLTGQENKLHVKILSASFEPSPEQGVTGSIVTDRSSYLKVKIELGYILIHELQVEGKRVMKTPELLRGFKQIEFYDRFSWIDVE
jgi:methionyl-tRNA formyltransferase